MPNVQNSFKTTTRLVYILSFLSANTDLLVLDRESAILFRPSFLLYVERTRLKLNVFRLMSTQNCGETTVGQQEYRRALKRVVTILST